jgi:hypothetical protein
MPPEFDQIREHQQPLHTRQRRYIMRELEGSSALFESEEVTLVDADGSAKTIEDVTVYLAGCDHVVGLQTPAELIGSCSKCGTSLCHRCGNLRCRRCLSLVCKDCARVVDVFVFCARCKWIVFAQWILGLGLSSLHEFLSKDVHE